MSIIRKFIIKGIINDDNILNDSINCIQKLLDSKKFEISFLTHVNSLDEGVSKINYLKRVYGNKATKRKACCLSLCSTCRHLSRRYCNRPADCYFGFALAYTSV